MPRERRSARRWCLRISRFACLLCPTRARGTIREQGSAIHDASAAQVRAADPDGWTIGQRAGNRVRLSFERGRLSVSRRP
jgi:hypothetical protein